MDRRTGEIFRSDPPPDREARRRMERARDRGELVEVSERVADLMEAAQKAERKKARKAAKAARKRNR